MFNIHINNTNNQANSGNTGVSLIILYQQYLQHPKRLYNLTYQDFSHLYTKWINEN
jgi:hypothetical protein